MTSDWRARLEAHNAGRCVHTASGRPWQVDVIIEFADERRAVAFEQYLKDLPTAPNAAQVTELIASLKAAPRN